MRLRRRPPERGRGVVVVELALVNGGVPIIYLPDGATAEQQRIVGAWLDGLRESVRERAEKATPQRPKLDSVRALSDPPRYQLAWDDGYTLTITDELGERLLDDLDAAHRLREDFEQAERRFRL